MRFSGILTFILGAAGLLYGQTEGNTAPAVAPVPQEEPQRTPGALGDLQPLTAATTEGGTYLIGSVHSSVSFDDNANSDNDRKQGGLTYELLPSFGVRVIRPALFFEAQYGPGWSWDQRLQSRNVFSQHAPFQLTYRVKRHWTLGINNEFKVTTNPVDRFATPSAGNLFNQPNGHSVLPHVRELTDVAGVSVTGQLSRRATVDFSGGYNTLQFDNVAGSIGAQLVSSEMVNARGAYNYRITSHQTMGGLYSFQRIWSGVDNVAQTDAHSFFYTHRIDLTSHSNLQLYGGPEYTHVQDQLLVDLFFTVLRIPIEKSQWSGAGGALYTWQGLHTGWRVNFRRTISNGGGFFGASRLHEARVDWRREINRDWTADASAGYGDTEPLNLDSATTTCLKTFDIGGGIKRRLRDDLDLGLNYAYLHQSQSSFANRRQSDHNRVALTLEYRFKTQVRR